MLDIAKLRSIQYQDSRHFDLKSDRSGSKTSLKSDPCHVGHDSQALARQYLQRLLSANPKGSHALLIAHPPILYAVLHWMQSRACHWFEGTIGTTSPMHKKAEVHGTQSNHMQRYSAHTEDRPDFECKSGVSHQDKRKEPIAHRR